MRGPVFALSLWAILYHRIRVEVPWTRICLNGDCLNGDLGHGFCLNGDLGGFLGFGDGRLQWSVVGGQWSVVSGQWSVVSGQWSVVSGQWSVVGGQWVAGRGGAAGGGTVDRRGGRPLGTPLQGVCGGREGWRGRTRAPIRAAVVRGKWWGGVSGAGGGGKGN